MIKWKFIAQIIPGILVVSTASHGLVKQSVDGAHVTGVYCSVEYNCSAYFDKDFTFTGTGKCATATGIDARRFQFDPNSNMGKSFLAILLTAQTTQALVYADGLGTCTNYGAIEDLNTIFIKNN